jgi:hypothetical protein|tara:strand:- start:889 stop:1593 length:705 start_codon:yes stop_codon:yes gene_type:complete
MPERVTREERKISLMIQKARKAKEILYQSLMDNNRNPEDDDSEAVKLKRPKAENYNYKAESNDGPATLHAYAGEITKMYRFMKAMGNFQWGNKVVNADKDSAFLLAEMVDFIKGDETTQKTFIKNLRLAADSYKQKLQKAVLPEDYETNPFLDDEKRVKLISQIDGLSTMLSGMAKQIKEAKVSEQPAIMDKMVEINQKLAALEKELSQVPEQTKFYDSEYSGETLDPEYERNR